MHGILLVYGFQCQEKIYDLKKLKTCRRWVSMDFHGTKKLLLMVSHDLWTQNWNIVFGGIWNMYFQKISITPPPPHPPQNTLWCAPPRPRFSIPGGLSWPPPPRRFEMGTSLNTLWKWTPPPLRNFQWSSIGGGGGVWIFYVILQSNQVKRSRR